MSKNKRKLSEDERDERDRQLRDERYLDFIEGNLPLFANTVDVEDMSDLDDREDLNQLQNLDEFGNSQNEEEKQSKILDENDYTMDSDDIWLQQDYIDYLNESGQYNRLRYLLQLSYRYSQGMTVDEQQNVEQIIQNNDIGELNYQQTYLSIKYDQFQEFPFHQQIDLFPFLQEEDNEQREQRRERKINKQREIQITREQQIKLASKRLKEEAIREKEIVMKREGDKILLAQKQKEKMENERNNQLIERESQEVMIMDQDEYRGELLYTYGRIYDNQRFQDPFNENKNLIPKLSRMMKFSNGGYEKANIPHYSQNPPSIDRKYQNDLNVLCKNIKLYDLTFYRQYEQVNDTNDGALIQIYIRQIAQQLHKSSFVREFLFRDNITLNTIIQDSIIEPFKTMEQEGGMNDQQRNNFSNQLRFIILGAPLYNSLQENYEQKARQIDLFNQQMVFVQTIENQEQNTTLMFLNYVLDGYMKSTDFIKFNQIKSQEMRQMFLLNSDKKIRGQRPRVGLFQTNDDDIPLQQSLKTDITDQFISQYLPFIKEVNISDLMFLNGIKLTVYYKVIRLFHNMYMQLRDSAPFTNTFNFYSKIPDDKAVNQVKIISNRNPMILISIILATVKEYLNIRIQEDFNYPENFMKELLFVVLPQQSSVTCQSIGCLYNYTISDTRLEPIVMIATLIIKVFGNNRDVLSGQQTFKLGWNFLKGAYQYITNFKYINTIIPEEWSEFYKALYQSFLSQSDLLTASQISLKYQSIKENYYATLFIGRTKRLERKQNHNADKLINLKDWIIKVENDIILFDISSLYFEKAFNFLQIKYYNYNDPNWNIYQASYLIAGIILDTFVIKIQESLNDTVKLQSQTVQTIINNGEQENISSASLQYFSIIQHMEKRQTNEIEIQYSDFKSMNSVPYMLWIKHCHQSYMPYDIVARDYHISCIIMLVWFSSTKQYNLGLGDNEKDRLQIYQSYQNWQDKNYETIEQCDNIFVNSTKLMSTLKKYLRQENLRVIQIANTQYALNVNQKKDEYLMLSCKNNSSQQFIVGIYYNHIFMINHFVPNKKYNEKQYIRPCLISKMETKSTYKPLINAIVFDIETTQIEIDQTRETQSHTMIPYMISSIQYQFTQRNMTILDIKTLYKKVCDFDFLEAMYQYWLNMIVLYNTDFYIITFNGCKFDLQFMYKYIAKFHSGCIEIFGTILSPKYIQISFNNHKIKFIDLYLILGEGSLNKWAEKCGLGQKLDYKAIYNIDQFLKLSLEEKQTIINYCEQDVKLTGSIYYQQCLNMVQMLKDLRIKFNWDNAIDVLKPTLASTAYSIFKNGFVNQSIKYINSIDWLTEQNVRQAYNGGFCHCFQLGEIKGDISYFDINSLYPFIMLQEFPLSPPSFNHVNIDLDNLPLFLEKEQYTHWKVIDYQYKEGTKICFIPQRINSMNFYFKSGYDLKDCYVPSYVLKLIINDLLFIRIRGALRYSCNFSYIFRDYVSKMYDLRLLAKSKKDELSEKRIKTLMNALYGKTAQSSKLKQDLISSEHRNVFETSGACSFEFSQYLDAYILDIPVSKDDSLSYLALEIASRARFYLFETIYKNKNGIIYCDTDSVILNQVPQGIKVDEIQLGYWKDVYKDKYINGLYIYSPKVYEIRYEFMQDGQIVQQSEVKMKGIDKSHQNFKENFKVLQNTFEGSFDEQVIWNKHNGFVRQNKISKKLKHRLRRFVNEDGSTRPFMDIEEYEKYFRKSLIIRDNKFIYI